MTVLLGTLLCIFLSLSMFSTLPLTYQCMVKGPSMMLNATLLELKIVDYFPCRITLPTHQMRYSSTITLLTFTKRGGTVL